MLEHLMRRFVLFFFLADLKFPCKNKKHSPCHRNATCVDFEKETFYCECNKGLLGDGRTCEKKRGIGFTDFLLSWGAGLAQR